MAHPYGHHNNFYDPVGSQANQPQGYTYQTSSTSTSQPASASYAASSYPTYGSHSYSNQNYGSSTNTQQNATSSNTGGSSHTTTGAGGLSGMTEQDNQASASRSNSALQYDSGMGSWGNPNYASSSSYGGSLNVPGRTQSTTSPLYASNTPSSFGRMSYNAPTQDSRGSSATQSQQSYGQQSGTTANSLDVNRRTYAASQHSAIATESSRYASPVHAMQAQQHHRHNQHQQQQSRHQGHARQTSRTSNQQSSPVVTARAPPPVDLRHSSASVEPMVNTTVDPSQIYDFRAETEKKAKAEAEKRRKREEAEAAKRAEEARVVEEKRLAEEAKQAEEAKRQMEDTKRIAGEQAAAARVEAQRKKEEQRKSRESTNAANALASLATSSNVPDMTNALPPQNEEEAEMRALFLKMREYNDKNPVLLARMWEEERRTHSQARSPQTPSATQPVSQPIAQPAAQPVAAQATTSDTPQNGASSTPLSGSTTLPKQMKPFSNPPKAKAPAARATPIGSANRETTNNQGPAANANLWPPGKKGLLADTAARWLHSVNPQKPVTQKEVLDLLDLNPNYVQLCEHLETSGLKFDRAEFARELLRGVDPASQHSQKDGDTAIMSANGTVAQASGVAAPVADEPKLKPKRSRATKAEMEQRRASGLAKPLGKQGKANVMDTSTHNNGTVQYEMPLFSAGEPSYQASQRYHMVTVEHGVSSSVQPPHAMSPIPDVNNQQASRNPLQSVQPASHSTIQAQQNGPSPVGSVHQTPKVKQPPPPRQPANKEKAARKRGFGELVDLTAEDSDEEMPPAKMMQPPHGLDTQGQRPHQQQHHSFTQPTARTSLTPVSAPPVQSFRKEEVPTAQMVMTPNASFGFAPPPMNNTPRVLTPNRNVLPSDAPTSNTAPPQSQPAPPKRKGPSNEQLQADRIKGRMVVEPIMRDRVLRRSTYDSRTIARDVLLATGRHPDMRPLNGHLSVMQKLLGSRGGMVDQSGNKSDLATIKWDIIDPDPPKKADPVEKAGPSSVDAISGIARSTEVDENDADDEDDVKQQERALDGARQASALDSHPHTAAPANNKPPPVPKKRGRPPRSRLANSNNDLNGISTDCRHNASENMIQSSGAPTSASRAASSSHPPSGTAMGYAAFRQLDEAGNPVKKKGRPVGWRKNIHSREAQGLTPAKPGTSTANKPKALAPKQNERLQEPTYQIYKCQWRNCTAELHSLEVLKKHVIKVHGRPDADESFYCSWKGCKAVNNDNPEAQPEAFEDIADWLCHVDKEHIQPVAWTLGDGPRGGLSDQLDSETSEAYLSDSRGRSVTPIITPMANVGIGENPDHTMPARPGRPPAGSSKDERVAFAELQKLKERKKVVGPTMEKTGVRLANSKRRMGFLDDENFEDFVESEGEGSR